MVLNREIEIESCRLGMGLSDEFLPSSHFSSSLSVGVHDNVLYQAKLKMHNRICLQARCL